VPTNTNKNIRLLVVTRDPGILDSLGLIGKSNQWQVDHAASPWEAMEEVQSGTIPDLLLLDLEQGGSDGLHILRWLRRLRPSLAILLIGDTDEMERKQEAIRMGALDYLVRPLDVSRLESSIWQHISVGREAADADMTSDDIETVGEDRFFIGISPIMRKLRAQAVLLAEANVSVLILGEAGTGKETIARLIHKLSLRSGFEFAKVNCALLPGDLLERELFGHQRADSMASGRMKPGKLEACAGGTIFLNEITEMSLNLQSSLLQALKKKRFIHPEAPTPVEVDVRILASSSTSAERAISEDKLREDLYYRLSAYTIHMPPLRERKEEIPFLLRHFMYRLARHYNLTPRDFSPAIIEACQAYSWPGNLRELENFVKRYLMVGDNEPVLEKNSLNSDDVTLKPPSVVTMNAMPQVAPQTRQSVGAVYPGSLKSLVRSVKLEAERNAIAAALERTGWNRKAAARLLEVSYRSLLQKIDQYHMKVPNSARYPTEYGLRALMEESTTTRR
jgi:two-component system, NtrC family, response regulator AtoC